MSEISESDNCNEIPKVEINEINYITVIEFILTLIFFALYIADIFSDLTLAIYLIYNNQFMGYIILIFISGFTSFYCTIFERGTRSIKGLKYYLSAVIIFVLNLSGVLLYKEIIIIQWQKIRVEKYHTFVNEDYLIKKKRDLAYLKAIEGFTESFPQIFLLIFNFVDAVQNNKSINVLEYFTFCTSFVGCATCMIGFVLSVTPDSQDLSILIKLYKYLWLFLVTVAKLTSLYLVILIKFSTLGFIIIFNLHLLLGRIFYKNSSISDENKSTLKKDIVTSTIFGLIFTIVPFLYTSDKNFYCLPVLVGTHLLHFVEILIITIWWAVQQQIVLKLTPFMYWFFIFVCIFGFLIGFGFFVLFYRNVNRFKQIKRCTNITIL